MANGFSVTITANDGVTATIDKINKRLQAFSAPYEKLSASMEKFGNVSGLNRVGKAFGDIGRSAFDVFRNVTRIVEPLAAITGAASIAGMYRLASAWADWGSRLGYNAERIGLSADKLNTFQNAARLAGVSADAMTGGMTHLKDAMTDALAGRNNDAMQYFQRLGISMKALHGTADSVMPQIISKIGALEKVNPTLAARVTSSIFGSEELLRVFRQGLPAFQQYIAQAKQLGGITDDQVRKADQLRQSQTALTISVEQFGYTLAAGLQPVIGPIVDFMTNWLSVNRDWLANTITDDVRQFVDYLKGANWKGLRDDFNKWYDAVKHLVDALGGPKAALEDLFLVMAGGFALKVMAPFLALAGALDGVLLKFGRIVLAARAAQAASVAAVGGEAVAGAAAAAGAAGSGTAAVVAGGEAAAGGLAGMSGLGLATPLLIGAAVTGTIAYLTAHGLSWLFGQGWNAAPTGHAVANQANRGHDPHSAIHSSSGPQRGNVPRGYRNNNPLNLTYVPGQIGVTGSDGRFGQYGTMSDGVAAAERQMLLNQNRGAGTLSALISKWAPPNENDTAGYIAQVAGQTGLDANAPVNMRDPSIASKVIGAMAARENGHPLDTASLTSGVNAVIGAGAPAQQFASSGQPAPEGKVVVHVQTDPGTKATVKSTTGNVQAKGVATSSIASGYAI
ncbi:hypothetical protein HN018_06930 [Lichenicola cladoniae]|uniref:Uncharacterized protein n=1 Tax=Lichenicola cladoniae TaxID=1484109 RepID=A0A6M8HN19_9PROT|nr:hypothetical protein [Lichenicola cladoniae]NPD67307.1 hypothetical protein [Acetobacteraceae bacterium]QKE89809.1 hypothetical protein HN018_06930 [Lichenicola cladoniae]